ncbi:MAG: hypothetical protein LBN97_09510 [Oscillospiraceae bacterium]|jgi:hypothetical protein|nr:hypothetical protein [Oscillospiraceae bacterium]
MSSILKPLTTVKIPVADLKTAVANGEGIVGVLEAVQKGGSAASSTASSTKVDAAQSKLDSASAKVSAISGALTAAQQYVNDLYTRKAQLTRYELESLYNSKLKNSYAQLSSILPTYKAARDSATGQSARAAQNFAELASAKGLASGVSAQEGLARNITLQSDLGQLYAGEAEAKTKANGEIAAIQADYSSKLTVELLKNEIAKLDALYSKTATLRNELNTALQAQQTAGASLAAAQKAAEPKTLSYTSNPKYLVTETITTKRY